jgi:hypothetical protein
MADIHVHNTTPVKIDAQAVKMADMHAQISIEDIIDRE